MSEQIITQLRTDIARLNRTLEALLTYNEVLRHENSLLRNRIGLENNFNSNVGLGDRKEIYSPSIPTLGDGITNNSPSIPTLGDGITNNSPSIPTLGDGNATNFNSIPKSGDGSQTFLTTHVNTGGGIGGVSANTSASGSGMQNAAPALPEKIEANESNAAKMSGYMRQAGFFRVSRQGVKHSALLLLHFYNKGAGNHAALIPLTGMSAGGLAKRMGSLRRRGFIKRISNKVVELTPSSMQIIRAAFG